MVPAGLSKHRYRISQVQRSKNGAAGLGRTFQAGLSILKEALNKSYAALSDTRTGEVK